MKKRLACIMLVDDDEPTNFLNKMLIEEMGCADHVVVAQSGREALDFLSARTQGGIDNVIIPLPDLIFLDINMPAMDGWEFLEIFRVLANQIEKKIKMVMLTTSLNPEDEVRSSGIEEVTTYKNKPFSKWMMNDILHNYFNGVKH